MKRTLFGLGVLALVVVLFAVVPAGLSPVGIAAGQSADGNGTSVVFANQTTNGSTITIKRATLPEGGFVVLTNDPFREIGILEDSIIAVSKPLSAGTYRNITLDVSHSPPGGVINQTSLGVTSDYAVGAFRDSNNNSKFDYITSRNADQPYIVGTGSSQHFAADAAFIKVPSASTPTPTANIQFDQQTASDSTVIIESVTLPNGGFVVIHNESYLHGGAPLASVVGHSQYLAPGTHRNVAVTLNGTVRQETTLVAIPARDSNGNQRYDFTSTSGFQDVAYVADGQIITDSATVKVPGRSSSTTPTTTTARATTTRISLSTPFTVTNLTVSNRTAYVGHRVIVTAWIENPTQHRLADDLAVATAGEIIETKQAALFPRERRAVKFIYTYGAPGTFVIKVGNQTEQIRIVPEGAPLTTTAANGSEAGVEGGGSQSQSKSGGGWGGLLWIAGGAVVLGLIGVVAVIILNRM